MDKPLEIAFHGLPPSLQIETEIRQYVDKLQRRFAHLVGCRVAVELLHRRHKTGNVYSVHIEMMVPRGELAVSHAPHRPRDRYAEADLGTCLRDAFRSAERQLASFKEKISGDVKSHAEAFAGQVAQLHPDEDYGFILTHEGTRLYFHRDSLMVGEFDGLKVGDRVHFTEVDGDTGPLAYKVWPAVGD